MPIVTIRLAKGRTLEQKRKLVRAVTDAVTASLSVEAEWVSVLIEEYERENWATGGALHSDKFGPGCGRDGTESN